MRVVVETMQLKEGKERERNFVSVMEKGTRCDVITSISYVYLITCSDIFMFSLPD
jgi:hypothetical protein